MFVALHVCVCLYFSVEELVRPKLPEGLLLVLQSLQEFSREKLICFTLFNARGRQMPTCVHVSEFVDLINQTALTSCCDRIISTVCDTLI